MESGALEATLDTHAFNQLRSIIQERAGIQFPDEKQYLLESRVRPRLVACGVDSFEEYVRYLKQEQDSEEITRLINAVTINETSFFRHSVQFEALGDVLLPELIEQRREQGQNSVRLWSAACSAGDEAYSLAILIRERMKPRYPHMDFQIVGTDINTKVLEEARTGEYRKRAIRNVPTAYLHKYFRRTDNTFVLESSIREMVTFKALNLTDAQAMRRMRDFDVIMCANVLIYLDQQRKEQVLHSLRRSLRPGGYLFVGGSEALGDSAARFESVQEKGAQVYRRPRTTSSPSTR
ncbi:MAG: protein-glutamate O-methyltransferase CheR [Salinibacter sp.]